MQNLVSFSFTADELAELDGALDVVDGLFKRMVVLQNQQRRELKKMGGKSETFCRQTLGLLATNPQIVPQSLGLAEAQQDLAVLDALRPRLARLQQLVERADDTEIALGSDVMATALEGYALLKVSGKDEALKNARRELSARFARTAQATDDASANA